MGTHRGDALRIAQLSDIHLFADPNESLLGIQTEESFHRVLDLVRHRFPRPDLLLLTGDLSQDGSSTSYERLRNALLDMPVPAFCLAGNHDCEARLRRILPMSCAVEDQHWLLLMVSSVVVDRVYGSLSEATLAWLEAQVAGHPTKNVLIAFHHPVLPLGNLWMDSILLQNSERFLELCHRHPQIRVVVNGHAHQEFDVTHSGVRYLVAPSTCVQFKPLTDQFQVDVQAPGFRMIDLWADGTVETTIYRVGSNLFQPNLAACGY
ncbi:MAG: 3',5'-cyclic-AMP phosphodiesterase [Oscillatoriales cyanobacterium SM2_2_1]|nr:3',5'-cyclic-AMP phosphodiesterase [Oscillatoriales cyanobacterium SM2_2_1]